MSFIIKLLITNLIIIGCTNLGKKFPSMAGLIATMPITTLAVLFWLNAENPSDRNLLTEYTRGVLWGILPTAIFFGVALICFKRGLPLHLGITLSFTAWLASAAIHQWMLR